MLVFRGELLPPSETFVLAQVRAMQRWHPTLVGYRRIAGGLDLTGVPVHIVRGMEASSWRRLGRSLLMATGSGQRWLARELLALRPDMVHVHFGIDAVDAWPLLRWMGVPVIVTLHGYDAAILPQWWRSGQGGPDRRSYPDRLASLGAQPQVRFIAVSRSLKERAVRQYGLDPGRIEVLHLGVDEARFSPTGPPAGERSPVVLFVGRMVEKKAADVLLRAMARVSQELPTARTVLIGEGPLRSEFEALARSLGVNARFLGAQPPAAVQRELASARVFCLPSVTALNGDTEGLPVAILEAQAAGIPVVTSATGGRDEGIQHAETGFAFQERDEQALALQLLRLLRDDALATAMGQRARMRVEEFFSIRQCTARLEAFYDWVQSCR